MGTFVFVPSYSFLYKLEKRIKDAVIESKEGGMIDFEKKIKEYQKRIALKKPALFLCVYRGKAAEGIDFRDKFARAVNQALGRAIRHSKDWGSVFLLDSRYSEKRYQSGLPNWITENLKHFESYDQCTAGFKNFIQQSSENKINI